MSFDIMFCDGIINLVHAVLSGEHKIDCEDSSIKKLVVIYPSGEKTCFPLMDVVGSDSGMHYSYFCQSLKWLMKNDVLSMEKHTKSIVIRLYPKYREIFEVLYRLHGRRVGVFTYTHYKLLLLLSLYPFFSWKDSLSLFLNMSKRGVKKIIDKLKQIGLISDDLKVTKLGSKLLRVCSEDKIHLADIMRVEVEPNSLYNFFDCDEEDISNLIFSLSKQIEFILQESTENILNSRQVFVIGIDYNKRLAQIVEEIANNLSGKFSVVGFPFVYPRTRYYERVVVASHYACTRILGTYLAGSSKIETERVKRSLLGEVRKLAGYIIRKIKGGSFVVLLAPRVFCLYLNHLIRPSEVASKGAAIIEVTRFSDSMLKLKNDFKKMEDNYRRLRSVLNDAFTSCKKIAIRWNINSDNSSSLFITPRYRASEEFNLSPIGSTFGKASFTFYEIPLGRLWIFNIPFFVEKGFFEVDGVINLLGEPIFGLKHQKNLLRRLSEPECILRVETISGRVRIRVEKTEYKYLKYILERSTVYGINIGVNELVGAPKKIDFMVISNTQNFMDIAFKRPSLLDPNVQIINHMLITDACIEIDGECVWKTIPPP